MAESNVAAAPKETQQSAKPTRKGSLLSRVAYSFGNVGQSAFYNALSTYFIVYVTSSLFSGVDKALATKLIGVITGLVVVIRIAEIFIDPLLGNIIDNTKTKWGRFKPWQLIGGTVSAVLLVLVYTGLFGLVNVNTTLFIVLFVITFIVLDVFYSLRDISYWGMIPSLGSDGAVRDQFTSRATLFAGVGGTLAGILVPMLTTGSHTLGGSAQKAYGLVALMFCIIGPVFLCFTIFGVREDRSYMQEAAPPVSFKKIWNTVTGNDQLLCIAFIFLLQQVGNGLAMGGLGSAYIYFAFGYEGGLYSLFNTIGVAATAFLMLFYPAISRKWPRKTLMKYMVFAASAAYLGMLLGGLFLPGGTGKFWLITVCYMITNLGQFCFYLVMMISILNTVEYNEYKRGVRDEAIIASLRPFLTKMASALIVLVTTLSYLAFGVTGYTNRISELEQMASRGLVTEAEKLSQINAVVAEATHFQTDGLLLVMSLLPWVCMVASYILYCKHYILDEGEYSRIVGILRERKEK